MSFLGTPRISREKRIVYQRRLFPVLVYFARLCNLWSILRGGNSAGDSDDRHCLIHAWKNLTVHAAQ